MKHQSQVVYLHIWPQLHYNKNYFKLHNLVIYNLETYKDIIYHREYHKFIVNNCKHLLFPYF